MQMVQGSTMGEDRISTTCVDNKKSCEIANSCRHRHSSVISSCSEDAESESTSAGYPSTYDEERNDEELQYGPGIVSKLKTRYLSIALKQNRGTNMRRSCSMENLLDQDRSSKVHGVGLTLMVSGIGSNVKKETVLGHLKRAKSMDTLLMDLNSSDSMPVKDLVNGDDIKKEPKIIRRRDGGLNRTLPMICDEELPKPDTVKTYKRMFEPAESRRGSHCRRPPVLRASAKSSALAASKSNGILSSPSAKTNGTSLKSKISAKQSPVTKAQSNVNAINGVNGIIKKNCTKDYSTPLLNGGHVVKASPVKLVNGVHCNNKETEKELNNINRLLNHKEVHFSPKTEIISNGNFNYTEDFKIQKKNMKGNHEVIGSLNSKPKIPPNKPTLKPPRPLPKTQLGMSNKDLLPKLKLSPINGLQKIPETEKIVESNFRVELKAKEEKPLSPETKQPPSKDLKSQKETTTKPVAESKSPEMSKLKNGFGNNVVSEKTVRDVKPVMPSPVLKKAAENVKDTTDSPMAKTKTLVETPTRMDSQTAKSKTFDTPTKTENQNEKFKPLDTPTKSENQIAKIKLFDTPTKLDNHVAKIKSLDTPTKLENQMAKIKSFDTPTKTDNNNQTDTKTFDTPTKMDNPNVIKPKTIDTPTKMDSPNVIKTKTIDAPSKIESPLAKFKTLESSIKKDSPITKTKPVVTSPINNKVECKPAKKSTATPASTSMVFDFRGKDVVPHVAVLPVPFGCKSMHPKKRPLLIDGKEAPNGGSIAADDEDEDYVDYSVPLPCGVVFEGENVIIGKGSILITRNKDLKITFVDDVDSSTFVYPSESSLLEDTDRSLSPASSSDVIPNDQPPPTPPKLKSNTVIGTTAGNAGGLSNYTPSVLRTMDNFEPGMFRPAPAPLPDKEEEKQPEAEEEENVRSEDDQDLKPADPDVISSWSLSAGTSDLLF